MLVYGNIEPTKDEEICHRITFLEMQIPEELEDELTLMVEKRVSEYEEACQCYQCKMFRGEV